MTYIFTDDHSLRRLIIMGLLKSISLEWNMFKLISFSLNLLLIFFNFILITLNLSMIILNITGLTPFLLLVLLIDLTLYSDFGSWLSKRIYHRNWPCSGPSFFIIIQGLDNMSLIFGITFFQPSFLVLRG